MFSRFFHFQHADLGLKWVELNSFSTTKGVRFHFFHHLELFDEENNKSSSIYLMVINNTTKCFDFVFVARAS